MKGSYHIIVQNKRIRYEFDIRRNITIIRGDSATGKTTLFDMITLAAKNGDSSGVMIQCEKQCHTLDGPDWKLVLPALHDCIIFFDESSHFLKTTEFAGMAKQSDNYFVIITRENLPNLPYSISEIYGIHSSGKYHSMQQTCNEFYQIYSTQNIIKNRKPDKIITEDSNSGYEFFNRICYETGIPCEHAGGKSRLIHAMQAQSVRNLLVIANGACIGPEMNELYQYMNAHPDTRCYLPESFEWLILKSGLIGGNTIQEILEHPQDYIESQKYFNWERFFTDILVQYAQDTPLRYSKHKLNEAYLHKKAKNAILNVIAGILFS